MSEALKIWREKLEYLQLQRVIAADAGQQFMLDKQIEEAKTKIAELEATAARPSPDSSDRFQHDISHKLFKYAPAELIGREAETQLLDDACPAPLASVCSRNSACAVRHRNSKRWSRT